MSDPVRANIYTIPAHRGFSDALVTGLIARFRDESTGLARLTLILPNSRARQAVTEAFVRQSGDGLLLPRMVVIGDLDLGESLGALLDPLGSGADVPPAADPLWRQLMLARFIRAHDGSPLRRDEQHRSVRQDVRLACQMGQTIDELLIARIDPASVVDLPIAEELAKHWQTSLQLFDAVWRDWQAALAKAGRVDAAERRNRLLDHAARRWQANPPAQPVIAAGISTAAPAIADLLRVIALSPKGVVVLPDLDQELDNDIWDNLGRAGIADGPDKEPFGLAEAYAHPQYHLKLLLGRIGVARDEVRRWHRSGTSDAPPARSRAISNVFLPAQHSRIWQHLKPDQRRLGPVRLMECENPAEEAQAIALLIRQRLDVPEQRIALVTPDRQLAERVAAHLARWNIMADDSGGRALSLSAPGALILCLAEALADPGAPVPLMAVLKHPLTRAGEGRLAWLDKARRLDLLLRGPRLSVGFGAIRQTLALDAKRREQRDLAPDLDEWWNPIEAALSALPARDAEGDEALADMIAGLVQAAEFFAGTAIWRGQEGRALADRLQALAEQGRVTGFALPPPQFAALMRSWLDEVAVRPAYGTHPRVAIYGLLEARLQQADLVICAGLNEGVWPQRPSPDPVIAPRMARSLGLASPEFRIGLSAHDLAGALGAPETVLTRAKRDMSGPTIASRFLLRIQAMLGPDLPRETAMPDLARRIDLAPPAAPYKQPKPMPPTHVRRVAVSATQLDRLRADPYTFYADKILGLRALDPLDALPGPAWRGTMIHAIIERWQRQGDDDPASLRAMAEAQLRAMGAHPLLRVLAGPRLFAGLDWLAQHHAALKAEGRVPLGYEVAGHMDVDGITLKGKADRIDALANGGLAIIDFKTGSPPSNAMVEAGFALQLGLLGLIARHDGFRNRHEGTQIEGEVQAFEYWTLKKRTKGEGFGYVTEPFRKAEDKPGMPREEFIDKSELFLREAIARWLNGDDPFTARLNPDLPGYGDYDQLMRLEEWFGRAAGTPLKAGGQ